MKRKLLLVCILCFYTLKVFSHHIIGGEMYYVFKSKTATKVTYQVTLKLYRGCEPVDRQHADFDPQVVFTIFDKDNLAERFITPEIPISDKDEISKSFTDPCIQVVPTTCYRVAYYTTTITVNINKMGYLVAYQRCCRSDLVLNAYTQQNAGATYYTELPGTENGIIGNSSAVFDKEEAILICANSKFQYDYSATLAAGDMDSISYEFAPAYNGGTQDNVSPAPATAPPYYSLSYIEPFSYESPLGPDVAIDPETGIISGRAPAAGTYVVAVLVNVYHNKKLISQHRKDFHIEVTDCHKQNVAVVPENITNCDSLIIDFPNASTTGKNYRWDFGDGTFSTEYAPVHTYSDTGTYVVKFAVDTASSCGDSTTSIVKVYPFLKEDFSMNGHCLIDSTRFLDLSVSTYNDIAYRLWDFGEQAGNDTSNLSKPAYQYKNPGTYNVKLSVQTSRGCVQELSKEITVYDKPPLSLLTGDTIHCYKDALPLQAQSPVSGTYTWTPDYNLNGSTRSDPIVTPQKDTTYYVTFTDGEGCASIDSVHIKTVNEVHVNVGSDTTLCKGDPLELRATSDEEYAYKWYDGDDVLKGTGKEITVTPTRNDQYKVVANIGTCVGSDALSARLVPYPPAFAGNDTSICYGDSVILHATGGAYYQWSPADSLAQSSAATTYAVPLQDMVYAVTVTDTLGCPKPSTDEVAIRVVPPVPAFAGNDTIITTGQVFQLQATGGTKYTWSPPDGLSDAFIADPLVNGKDDIRYLVKVETPEGCFAYDSIAIRYITGPDIYVPNAFSPNGDGKNDIFRPIPVGITEIYYFRVFNRWGNEVYATKDYLKGWNGYYRSAPADAGTYVWVVNGKDFNGRNIVKKGTVILLR